VKGTKELFFSSSIHLLFPPSADHSSSLGEGKVTSLSLLPLVLVTADGCVVTGRGKVPRGPKNFQKKKKKKI